MAKVKEKILTEVSREAMKDILISNETDDEHWKTVDISKPGIAIQMPNAPEGTVIMIDGNHRVRRAYEEKKKFYAYLLSWAAYEIIEATEDERNGVTLND